MRNIRPWALAALIPLLAGCTTAFVPSGTNIANLATVDFSTVDDMRRGEACSTTILGIFTQGDAMITTAAENGGISHVDIVEHKVSMNPFYSKQCVIVFGR